MMDESNDKTNKSCIILVRVFDHNLSGVVTRFVAMPIVNIGTAKHLSDAQVVLKCERFGLLNSRVVAFMSDTTNAMKGSRSGVQKLIKDKHPNLYDVGCICHLADLVVKAGMCTIPLNIYELFVDVFLLFSSQ